jgi:hypothetical protein
MSIVVLALPDWVTDVADVAQIVGIALVIPAAYWAYKQLKSATASAESQAVLALDQAFSLFEDFRKQLNVARDGVTTDDVTLRRYVATFERLGLLVQNGVVGPDLADQLYGSRLAKLLTTSIGPVRKIVAEREGKGWENFLELWKLMHHTATHRNLPPLTSESSGEHQKRS